MSKVFATGSGVYGPHRQWGESSSNLHELQDHPERFCMVLFPGGADINPKIYGHQANPKSYYSDNIDSYDLAAYKVALEHGIPCVGICRGGQLLIALAGGYLYQHTTGHGREHLATSEDGLNFPVTSCHHQMFGWPLPDKARLLAWSTARRSHVYEVGDGEAEEAPLHEPECVYLPTINAVATQWHPEWMDRSEPGRRFHEYAVERFLGRAITRRAALVG